MFKNVKQYIAVIVILLLSLFLLNNLLNKYYRLEQQRIDNQLSNMHRDAIVNAKAGIEVYASLVSSLKSYTKNTPEFPNEIQFQNFLKDFLKEIKFNDSIIINFIDKDHVFNYVITPNKIDPKKLKGVSVKNIKSDKRITELNALMQNDNIKLFSPINLREGWTGFPFNFSARNSNNEILGYVTPIINVKYLLDYFYENESKDLYVHRFLVNDSFDVTREAYYDGSEIYNTKKDKEYYKNYNVSDEDFIYSTIELFGLKLKIGSAYKKQPTIDKSICTIAYIWFALMSILTFVVLHQYLKNRTLSNNLKTANANLEKNLFKIRTLIKEVHHRVKNNMNMISGLLIMQEDENDDENVKEALRESQNRIQSMSLVHEKLYGADSLREIKLKDYIIQLIETVENTIAKKDLNLQININVDEELLFDPDTTADLGLMINELVTNSFKYAFRSGQANTIDIQLDKENEFYKLTYSDSGDGLPDEFDIETSKSLGMKLLVILAEQLQGGLKYNRDNKNTFVISFKPITQ